MWAHERTSTGKRTELALAMPVCGPIKAGDALVHHSRVAPGVVR
jgi:hypothetical protein